MIKESGIIDLIYKVKSLFQEKTVKNYLQKAQNLGQINTNVIPLQNVGEKILQPILEIRNELRNEYSLYENNAELGSRGSCDGSPSIEATWAANRDDSFRNHTEVFATERACR